MRNKIIFGNIIHLVSFHKCSVCNLADVFNSSWVNFLLFQSYPNLKLWFFFVNIYYEVKICIGSIYSRSGSYIYIDCPLAIIHWPLSIVHWLPSFSLVLSHFNVHIPSEIRNLGTYRLKAQAHLGKALGMHMAAHILYKDILLALIGRWVKGMWEGIRSRGWLNMIWK